MPDGPAGGEASRTQVPQIAPQPAESAAGGETRANLDALRESEARFRVTFERAPVGLAHVGIGGEWLAVNARLCAILGFSREELLATRFQELTHPDDLAADLDQALRLVAGEVESYTMPKRYVRKDGSAVWARLTGSLVRETGGAPFHFLAVIDEITGPELERLRAETAGAKRLAAALTATQDGAWDWDVTSGAVVFSDRWCRMLGYAPSEIEPHVASWERLVHPDDRPSVMAALSAHLEGHTDYYESEHRLRRRDGGWTWVLDRGQVVTRDAASRPLRMVGTHKEITARRETAVALVESEARARRQLAELEAVYRSARVGLGFLDVNLRYVRVNSRLAAMNGATIEAHLGRTPAEVMPTLGPRIERLLRQVLTTGEPVRQLEFRAEAPGEPGEQRDWVVDYDPVTDVEGVVIGVTAAIAEVTAFKRAEAEAVAARERAEKADRAKSEFLATMSHELRTPLNAIAGHTQLLEMGLYGPVTETQTAALARIDRAQRHLLRLVNDVLNLSRLESGRVEYDVGAVSLAAVVAELDPLITPQVREKGLTLVTDIDPSCLVLADRDKLVQVLINLVSNAVKFTPTGGTVTVTCAARSDGSGDGAVVYVRVQDSGVGIAHDRLAHIFEPFVQVDTTLAGRAAGTGLGLTISRDLARGMGGDLRVRSTPGVGSSFTVTLPRARA